MDERSLSFSAALTIVCAFFALVVVVCSGVRKRLVAVRQYWAQVGIAWTVIAVIFAHLLTLWEVLMMAGLILLLALAFYLLPVLLGYILFNGVCWAIIPFVHGSEGTDENR